MPNFHNRAKNDERLKFAVIFSASSHVKHATRPGYGRVKHATGPRYGRVKVTPPRSDRVCLSDWMY